MDKEPFTITEHIPFKRGIHFSFQSAGELFDKIRKAIFLNKIDSNKRYKIIIKEI